MKVEFIDPSERFGMCGTWIGELKIDSIKLKHEFLDKNYSSSSNGDFT